MKSKFKKLLATALVLCLVLALLPAAAFAGDEHTVTVQNNKGTVPANGTVKITIGNENEETVSTGNNTFKAEAGATITVTVQPKSSDYELDYIKCNGKELTVTNNTATFKMLGENVILEVVFQHVWSITIDDDIQNGKVCCQISALANEIVTITATPNTGYELEAFHVYGAGTNGQEDAIPTTPDTKDKNKATFQMPNHAVIVSATFKRVAPVVETYNINCVDNSTYGTFTSDKSTAQEGDVVTITVKPNWGYYVDDIYYMTSTSGIIPPSGWDFTPIGDNKWQFSMPESNVWVYVSYKPYFPGHDYHAINVTSDGHCSVDVKNWAYCGEDVTINLSNFDTGYAFSYLKVDGVSVKPYGYNGYLAYTFEMPHSDVTIEVGTTNVSGMYYIDTSYDSTLGGVEVWVNNNYVNNWHQGSWADYQDTVSFKVKPYYSDDVVSVSVVGKQTGWTYSYDYNSYSGWYTFSMPKEDVTISVDFRSGVHKVYVDTVTDGKLTVSDDWAKYGQIVYVTAVPDYGCTLSSLSVRTATGDSVHVYNAQKADTYYFYMPDQYVSVSAVFTGKYTSVPFNDVSYGDWYYDAVQFVYSRGIMDGVDYYKFAPNGTITRGMILTMLWRMAGEPFEMPVTSFTDVEIGRYYTTAVAWACRNGIADGMGETKFGPNDAITREELVTLMYRYAQYFGHSCIGTSIEGFADAGSVSSYAYNAMCWAYKAGVVTGTTGSRLNPQGTASRAEAAQMIMSFYSFLNS